MPIDRVPTAEPLFSISAVARPTGVSTHTLRYYQRAGLMLGPSITRLRRYVELVRRGEESIPDRLEPLLIHRMTVVAQLEKMTQSLAAIDSTITTYQGRMPSEQ